MKNNLRIYFLTLFCMLLAFAGRGQVVSPFTTLSSNIDTGRQKIYIEIMYEKPSCLDYQVKFRMDSKKGSVFVKVDSFLNNQGTYTSLGDSVLQRPTAGGYKLRFQLPNGVTVLDSPLICLESQVIPYRCEGCGAAGSSPLFSQNDIHYACPYTKDDLIACNQSRSTGQWEAWIQDPRDCKPYKIVLMPDNRWWFAQNLNYQKDLQYHTLQSSVELGNAATRVGEYFCPNGYNVSSDNAGSKTIAITNTGGGSSYNYSKDNNSISPVSCKTYGALYTWTTAMSLNGRTTTFPAVPITDMSNVQGICPEGWKLPSSFDWRQVINQSELGSTTVERTRVLKSTNSCLSHSSVVDSICSTYDNPAWAWRRSDYNGKISYPYALGSNKYGLALVPNGYIYGNATPTNRYYHFMGTRSYTWLSSESGSNGYTSYLDYSSVVGETTLPKIYAAGVRCMSESDLVGIDGPNGIHYGLSEVTFSLYRPLSNWTYTWSVKSDEIAGVGDKIKFRNNGTNNSHTITADLDFTASDIGKSFTLIVNMTDGLKSREFSKKIVIALVGFTKHPQSRTLSSCSEVVELSVEIEGGMSPVFQWYVNGVNSTVGGIKIDGANSKSYLVQGEKMGSQYFYYCVVEDSYNSDTSNVAVITLPSGCNARNFDYTGGVQSVTLAAGTYKMEVWGAGSTNTTGSYCSGIIDLDKSLTFYVYVGQAGVYRTTATMFNGGGRGGWEYTASVGGEYGGSGGGATDIRLTSGAWNNTASLYSRLIVAGGAGGKSYAKYGGHGGGITSYNATQTSGYRLGEGSPGVANLGWVSNFNDKVGGGGSGGGYYGGISTGTATSTEMEPSGTGGSSFISGHSGCNAINSSGGHTGQPKHYSGYVFRSTSIIPGGSTMPNPAGGNMTGKAGNGYARITKM